MGAENVPTNVPSMITYYVILLLYFSSRKLVFSKHESLVFHYTHVFGGHPFKRRILIISPCCGVYVVLSLVLCVVIGGSIIIVCLMVFDATFYNISAISWRSVLLVEETGGPGKTTDLSQVTGKLYHIMMYISPWSRIELTAEHLWW